ncbi:hypothetical protein CKA38_13355 [Ereboglobus luteus]|uniref:Uncharacterized protein n=2 Tax=Ereboglobus luteus TaxID=1796921 RepID=A0A2U8E5I6_9BACT|nr:hypothetical protein CKA38_13355 [Ereboglobus luteus]
MRVYLKENARYAHDYLLKDLDNEDNFRAYNEGRGDMNIVLDITGDADPKGAYAVAEKLHLKLKEFVTATKKEYQDYMNSNDMSLSAEDRDIKIRSLIVPIQSRTYRMERLEAFMQRLREKYGVGGDSAAELTSDDGKTIAPSLSPVSQEAPKTTSQQSVKPKHLTWLLGASALAILLLIYMTHRKHRNQ